MSAVDTAPAHTEAAPDLVIDPAAAAAKTEAELTPSTKSRLANLFNRVPKLGKGRSKDADPEVSKNPVDKVSNCAKTNQQAANTSQLRY